MIVPFQALLKTGMDLYKTVSSEGIAFSSSINPLRDDFIVEECLDLGYVSEMASRMREARGKTGGNRFCATMMEVFSIRLMSVS